MRAGDDHRYVLRHLDAAFVAACSCGWAGEPVTTAGMASASHGRHVFAGGGDTVAGATPTPSTPGGRPSQA
jgi:hypothetical protein